MGSPTVTDVRTLIEQAVQETRDGTYFQHMLQVIVGRKAEGSATRLWTRL